ncbi:hypothetical protein MA16_Dca014265 [Dendrobium catenatum]|uniref:Uncharacterized protein n=1 Tax=Dendrobium catenatum TaxID=906689 RepID=A0A2I0VJW3_9ASPA|nr:hypothetical protein MA16_Dca014265 [Dendrobium catenatum]
MEISWCRLLEKRWTSDLVVASLCNHPLLTGRWPAAVYYFCKEDGHKQAIISCSPFNSTSYRGLNLIPIDYIAQNGRNSGARTTLLKAVWIESSLSAIPIIPAASNGLKCSGTHMPSFSVLFPVFSCCSPFDGQFGNGGCTHLIFAGVCVKANG